MPPVSSKAKSKSQSRDSRRSRSRNTTPISGSSGVANTIEPSASPSYLHTALSQLANSSSIFVEDIFNNVGGSSSVPMPDSLQAMLEDIKGRFIPAQTQRGETSERFMRHLMKRRKERMEQEREKERMHREAEERRHKLKKVKKREPDEDRPLAVGAHQPARQDGQDVHKDVSSTISSPISQPPPSATGTGKMEDRPSPSGSEESHQPRPAPAVPQFQTFGPDPSKFDDPTVYDIRPITPNMSEEEKKEILGVAHYPKSDLHDLTAGTPPDKDFSNAKPAQQATFHAFSTLAEPYLRPITEEDLAFLKERGDRVQPFQMPRRGPRHYKEIWAEEDGAMAIDPPGDPLPPHEPRGSIDQMNDDVAETEEISAGPVIARLNQLLRSERRNPEDTSASATTNGDIDMDLDTANPEAITNGTAHHPQPPATYMPDSQLPSWKQSPTTNTIAKPDFASLEERALQELAHCGLLAPDVKPDYSAHFDDEIAARLRYLQSELQTVALVNGARKARLLDLAQVRMAQQEYGAIEEDLNTQLNQAYLKRNRNLGKGKNKKAAQDKARAAAAAQAAAAAAAAAGGGRGRGVLGEEIKGLMEKRQKWKEVIGPVVDFGRTGLPEKGENTQEEGKYNSERW
ncbi:hypothetical protein K490DRAFT_71275 [Saccharata proteae CBS 121410]|uniref:Transcriptional regulator Ngg1 n=1 Tax=Saccharata proteae CBS 121410 TaxID=1314787 RepID=A0A9P4I2J3_9PEZI|nr:hypothetical protein K490DRAFT_71275 [Saccharata proteae CBS 121410]